MTTPDGPDDLVREVSLFLDRVLPRMEGLCESYDLTDEEATDVLHQSVELLVRRWTGLPVDRESWMARIVEEGCRQAVRERAADAEPGSSD